VTSEASHLFPQVMSFPLQMAIVTHPRFPVPIVEGALADVPTFVDSWA
jgi:hypothetical protein